MTERDFRQRLMRRARRASVHVPDAACGPLQAYFELLARWNTKINLTALPLTQPTDETFDRLLVEPLAAARFVGDAVHRWVDLGSGGGSPAIPLKISCPVPHLVMVESKARKAAFLREAIRSIPLPDATVENLRFEELAERPGIAASFDLLTVRAVRTDRTLASAAAALLSPEGRVLLFTSQTEQQLLGFQQDDNLRLGSEIAAFIASYRRNVPRGT